MTADLYSGADAALRAEIVHAARQWLGTPYCHQASQRGAGADCLGLIRGVWRDVYGPEPEHPPGYTPCWSEISGRELLLEAAGRHMLPIAPCQAEAGDVLVFRMRDSGPAKHAGLLTGSAAGDGRILHAYSGHAVCETSLTPAWQRRVAGAFRFPLRG